MAEMDWARAAPAARTASPAETLLQRLPRIIDWEAAITLFLALGAVISVTVALENGGWSSTMPPLTTVSVIAVVAGMLLARSRLSALVAWPLAVGTGAAVVFWQALVMAGPGALEQRLDALYYRFDAWFDVAFSDAVTNDPLPFNVLAISITWLGVFLFSWSVFRWHNAWIGLIPGGIALFLDLVLVGDSLSSTVLLYMLFGFLLVMQTNLLSSLKRWRAEGTPYPPMLNLTFLNFSLWALIGLVCLAWIAPTGPFSTPAPVQSLVERALESGSGLVRLAGPLQSKKVIPVHSYSGVLPFQGSVKLGDRELLAVTVEDPALQGPFLLRGSVYEKYEGGGWTTGPRRQVPLPAVDDATIPNMAGDDELDGALVPLHVELAAKSVVGTVVFTPGNPVAVSRDLTAQVAEASIVRKAIPVDGQDLSDEEILRLYVDGDEIGVYVQRDAERRVRYIEVFQLTEEGLLDADTLDPGGRIKRHQSYDVVGFIPNVTPGDLRAAGVDYPDWISGQYVEVPDSLPPRVSDLAAAVTLRAQATNAYDQAKAIEAYLREYPVDYKVEDTPPGADAVDYFLFESRRGYFDYHASAMVVMLRTLGVPSRLAVGFVADESDRDGESGAYIVRDENSYAWPEVYFPGHGWVAFNPTPDRAEVLRPSERADVLSGEGEICELRGQPISCALLEQLPASAGDQGVLDEGLIGAGDAPSSGALADGGNSGVAPWVTVLAAGFVLALAAAVMLGWQRSVAGLPYPQQIWEKTIRLATWGGAAPEPGQTPHEFARDLSKRLHGTDGLNTLADAYAKSRFGRKQLGPDETESLRKAWPHLRGALIGGITGRLFRRSNHGGDVMPGP